MVVLTVLPCVIVVTVLTTVVVTVGAFWTTGAVGRIPVNATGDVFTAYVVEGLRTTVVMGRT